MTQPVGFDLETAPANELFTRKDGFVKIAGYTYATEGIAHTTDMTELLAHLEQAPYIYGHNIFGFDLLALVFHHGMDWEALARKAVDTEILDRLDNPPMARDTGGSVDKYDLDHVCERRGVPGKTADLKELAKKHGGFDNIPVDDPEYIDYLAGDVEAIRSLLGKLPNGPGNRGPAAHYARREHKVAAINGRMTLNGFRVDIPLLEERISEGEQRKRKALEILRDDYDLPLGRLGWTGRGDKKVEKWEEFDSPLRTLEGRKWLAAVWNAFGINNPPITNDGSLSTSAETLKPIAESHLIHPELANILYLMMIVTSVRTVYQTAKDHLSGDRVHPLISMRQASGRSSVTAPGLTVFGKRGGRHREREIFLPDNDDEVLLSVDASQIDMRGIAGHCQDPAYMAMFGFDEDGKPKDIHTEIAMMVTGNPADRNRLKSIGHGANYGLGKNKMIAAGHDPRLVDAFFAADKERFPVKWQWREEIREIGKSGQLLDNGFGRKMRVDTDRYFTQAPALMGQGTAADLIKEIALRLDPAIHRMMKVPVHDEYVFSVPKAVFDEVRREVIRAFTFEWRGVPILCDASDDGKNWGEVSAK